MLSDAIAKLTSEINNSTNNSYIQVVGQFLLSHLDQNPQDAENILTPDKTIGKSLDEMRKAAEMNKVGNCAVLSDQEGFTVVLKYFGIEGQAVAAPVTYKAPVPIISANTSSGADFNVKLDDFL